MPPRLILIAHAETSATRRGVFPAGEGLESRGREAAERLAHTLPQSASALTSPASAARETAAALGLVAEVVAALADLDMGKWTGRSVMEIGTTNADSAAAWLEDPAFAGHGGESFEALIARIRQWLMTRVAIDGVTIGISHAAVLRAAVIAVLGADAKAFWRIDAAPLAQLALSSNGSRWIVRELRQP